MRELDIIHFKVSEGIHNVFPSLKNKAFTYLCLSSYNIHIESPVLTCDKIFVAGRNWSNALLNIATRKGEGLKRGVRGRGISHSTCACVQQLCKDANILHIFSYVGYIDTCNV